MLKHECLYLKNIKNIFFKFSLIVKEIVTFLEYLTPRLKQIQSNLLKYN